jgi:CubicO group peptidase (beta-lactamase class C family)
VKASLLTLFILFAASLIEAKDASVLDPAKLQAAAQYSASEDGAALIVVQHGRELLRQFHHSHRPDEALRIYSGTKFFWCMAACVAEHDGLLQLDEPVARTITEWHSSKTKSAITIRQLLNFTSGLAAMEELHEDNVSNRGALAVNADIVATPGTRFIYGPASMQVFHEVLKRKLAPKHQTPVQFLERNVLRPLGLGPQRYVPDKSGTPLLDAGFMLTADQWLKIGKLLLQNGKPVMSSASLGECLASTSASPAFGLGLWNNRLAASANSQELNISKLLLKKWPAQDWRGGCLCKTAPPDLIACIGSHGQRIYVVPSMDLIVLRTGVRGDFSDTKFLRLLFAH